MIISVYTVESSFLGVEMFRNKKWGALDIHKILFGQKVFTLLLAKVEYLIVNSWNSLPPFEVKRYLWTKNI